MAVGGMFGVSALSVGMSFALQKWVKEGKSLRAGRAVPQLEMGETASAPMEVPDRRKGQLEIEFHGNAYAVEHHGNMEIKRQINLVLPTYPEEELF